MESAVGDDEANLATMERWAKEAAKAGVEILLYPELCVSGYDCSDAGPLFPEAIPPIPSDVTERLCAMAAEHGMMMLPGLLEREPGGAVFNTQLVIEADGTLQGCYRKTHPGITELPTFGAGDELPIFHHPKVTFGVQICYVSAPPSHPRPPDPTTTPRPTTPPPPSARSSSHRTPLHLTHSADRAAGHPLPRPLGAAGGEGRRADPVPARLGR